jgi:hypothetical protein
VAVRSTDRSLSARKIAWQANDVLDYQRFPARPIRTHPPTFHFRPAPDGNRRPVQTVPVHQGGRVVWCDLAGFLHAADTTAFLVLKGDTLRYEGYFDGSGTTPRSPRSRWQSRSSW